MKELKDPYLVIEAYRNGYFPMATHRHGNIEWHSPDPRAIIPLDNVKTPKSMNKKLRKGEFDFTVNSAFKEVVTKCADRNTTWINNDIIETYTKINHLGFANSVETWQNGELVGGLYGVTIGAAFFGESMFNTVTDAAKAAFYHLINILKKNKYILLDSQYINPFTEQLGAVEIRKHQYDMILNYAVSQHREFY